MYTGYVYRISVYQYTGYPYISIQYVQTRTCTPTKRNFRIRINKMNTDALYVYRVNGITAYQYTIRILTAM